MSVSRYLRLRGVRIAFLVLLFLALTSLLVWEVPSVATPSWLPASSHIPISDPGDSFQGQPPQSDRCVQFPDPGNIAIAVKTGATEAVEKIPLQMQTTLQCARNVKIFSDLEQDIAGYHLQDALSDIPKSTMEGNADFDFYWKLKDAQRLGQIAAMLRGSHDPRVKHDLASWTLDKYKQIHILEKLYKEHPDKDWYLMIDADTYVVWPNLLSWLSQLPDPKTRKMYLGSPAVVGDVKFAHGGSGVFLSHAAMYELAVVNKGLAASWDRAMHDECCGDYVIGLALKKMGIVLQESWPTVNGEKPITLPFGPTHWCQPLVTMHHVQPNEMNQLDHFEMGRNGTKTPLTLADLFLGFVKRTLPERLDDWNNDCHEVVTKAESFDACRQSCENDKKCFQFTFHGGECARGYSIHLGVSKQVDGSETFRSGWLLDRIYRWVHSQPICDPKFPFVE